MGSMCQLGRPLRGLLPPRAGSLRLPLLIKVVSHCEHQSRQPLKLRLRTLKLASCTHITNGKAGQHHIISSGPVEVNDHDVRTAD